MEETIRQRSILRTQIEKLLFYVYPNAPVSKIYNLSKTRPFATYVGMNIWQYINSNNSITILIHSFCKQRRKKNIYMKKRIQMNVIRFKKSFFVIHLVICILYDLSFLIMHTLSYHCILIRFLFFFPSIIYCTFSAASSVLKACLGHFIQLKVLIFIEAYIELIWCWCQLPSNSYFSSSSRQIEMKCAEIMEYWRLHEPFKVDICRIKLKLNSIKSAIKKFHVSINFFVFKRHKTYCQQIISQLEFLRKYFPLSYLILHHWLCTYRN